MDINKTYRNPKLEARRQLIIQRNQADQVLRRHKDRAATAREQILAAFEGRDIGPVSAVLLRNLGQLDFGLEFAATAGGVTWSLVVQPPRNPARRLAYDTFLRLIATNRRK